MLRVASGKTYGIIKALLLEKKFKQRELARELKTSPARVNEVVQWLIKNNLVEKYKNRYEVLNPIGVIKLFTYSRRMDDLKQFSIDIKEDRERLFDYLRKRKVVFCLTSALQEYSAYFRDPSINFYARDYEQIRDELKTLPQGMMRINVYKPDVSLESDTVKKDGMLLTSELRTVIDLFCDNKAYAAKELIEKLWGVRVE